MSKAACKYELCGSDNAAADPVMMSLARAVIAGDIQPTKKLEELFMQGAALLERAAANASAYAAAVHNVTKSAMAEAFA